MIEEDRGTIRAVAWSELFPWLILFRCFRLSIGPRPLLLSTLAALATILGWSLFGLFFSVNAEVAAQHSAAGGCPWIAFAAVANDPGLFDRAGAMDGFAFAPSGESIVARSTNPVVGTWEHLSRPFREVFTLNMGSGKEFQASKMAYSMLCALWALTVWAFAGGAVSRDAAVQLACGERVGWGGMISYARKKWKAYVWGPLFPFLVVFCAAVVLALLGLFMRSNWLLWIAGLLWPLVLAAGFLMALGLLGLAFGWPLMFATVSTEGTDSFDAISRSYAYVFQRPLHYLFYVAVVTVVGLLGWLLVFGFVQTLIGVTQGAVCWGSGGQFVLKVDTVPYIAYQFGGGEATSHLGWLGELLIRVWCDFARLIAVGFLYSYFWVSASAIYLLLRRDVDDTELDEVHLEDLDDDTTFGLPEIRKDEVGAPVLNHGDRPLSETE